MVKKEKVYMVCDWDDGNAGGGAMNIGVEFMGFCTGRILKEDGTVIGSHTSSSFGWLRVDLKNKIKSEDRSKYDVVDLIGMPVPERFRLKTNEN